MSLIHIKAEKNTHKFLKYCWNCCHALYLPLPIAGLFIPLLRISLNKPIIIHVGYLLLSTLCIGYKIGNFPPRKTLLKSKFHRCDCLWLRDCPLPRKVACMCFCNVIDCFLTCLVCQSCYEICSWTYLIVHFDYFLIKHLLIIPVPPRCSSIALLNRSANGLLPPLAALLLHRRLKLHGSMLNLL